MMIRSFKFALALSLFAFKEGVVQAAIGDDYIAQAPMTVYEDSTPSPQNMDYDMENKMFPAHGCWYNDRLVHYYKFRMYTPGTYPGVIAPGATFADVPFQKIYFVTTTGDMTGVVGNPIIQYHTADGLVYSDFMQVNLVNAPQGYTPDMFKSEGDIMATVDASDIMSTGIMLNIPVVPTGSTLGDPAAAAMGGSSVARAAVAPISEVRVWYKGVEVWTYVFEVTDQAAADYFSFTRVDPMDTDYAITVTDFASSSSVFAIPLWHVNQYTTGVTSGVNNGGPSHMGMRNVINLDRADPGYSPLWQILWLTGLPINYSADEASNRDTMTEENGFAMATTPMFVNCPDIGAVGSTDNAAKLSAFETSIDAAMTSNMILGSDMSLIMRSDVVISFQVAGTEIASTVTNMMGAYEYELMSSDIPDGTTAIEVMAEGTAIRTITVTGSMADSGAATRASFTGFLLTVVSVVSALVAW